MLVWSSSIAPQEGLAAASSLLHLPEGLAAGLQLPRGAGPFSDHLHSHPGT